MSGDDEREPDLGERLRAAVEAARADVKHLRKRRSAERSDRVAAGTLGAQLEQAIAREDKARLALRIFEQLGTEHGLVAEDDRVRGSLAVSIPPGSSAEARREAIASALDDALVASAASIGAVPSARPERFARERPGRDAQGRTVLDVEGRAEGDRLVPAIKPTAH